MFYEWNVFRFGQILFNFASIFAAYHEKIFVPAFFKGLYWSLTYFIILSLEKEIIVLEKSLEKS